MEEPLLFIPTPPFYYIEVEEAEPQDVLDVSMEESTSVYEIARSGRVVNPVIARQLNFFSQPINSNRILRFYLSNGESITGKIQEINGNIVKINNNEDIIEIDGNQIEVITTSR
ncbi:hypothetical protein [Lysinibacillus endophyticus]|uniref:4-diphosphocytidyl-2C-methyl-D-erythritol kinase n=1 Tax=Ureibacillus endophyticus TaxID=1978490 RepID=A0A494Z532_9BACL|nr:hypothetical protein [Lysinibacillus endophyticus]MCP1143826.1 hypothetical protein [Lysinibacillus endophyticus]RKQ17656.1 hypothetical protein D8M03_07075 [Lysinibacillus endophyticus]